MRTPTNAYVQPNLVRDLRRIRDQFSAEIQDMSFEEERAYLDKLLAKQKNSTAERGHRANGADR